MSSSAGLILSIQICYFSFSTFRCGVCERGDGVYVCVRKCVYMCVCVCMRACVCMCQRAGARACVCVCLCRWVDVKLKDKMCERRREDMYVNYT